METGNGTKKAAVFIILGQSNAVGHGIPMAEEDKIKTPLRNVFGLSRALNQSFEGDTLVWSGYESAGMNLAEEQDHTYSIPNVLAKAWQGQIDGGAALPDLYLVQIAIGGQGVSPQYMWHPDRAPVLVPGVLGTVNISLFPYTMHILSLLEKRFSAEGVEYEVIGMHWRGGEDDATVGGDALGEKLLAIYQRLLDGFTSVLGPVPTVLHRICAHERMNAIDPSGGAYAGMETVNGVFEALCEQYPHVQVFDPRTLPMYRADVHGNGLFIEDCIHFTPEVNRRIAEDVLSAYMAQKGMGEPQKTDA